MSHCGAKTPSNELLNVANSKEKWAKTMIRQICLFFILIQFSQLVTFSQCFNPCIPSNCPKSNLRPLDKRRFPTFDTDNSQRSISIGRFYMVGDAKGEYYGESAGSYMVQEFKYVVTNKCISC